MIPLAMLLGGVLFLGLYAWLGQPVVVVLAAALSILVLIGVISDIGRTARDRATAIRRWKTWRVGDAMRVILGGERRRG